MMRDKAIKKQVMTDVALWIAYQFVVLLTGIGPWKGFYGEVLGVAGSVVSICRAGAPAINGVLVEKQGVTVPVFLAAFCFLAVTILSPCLVEKDVTSASTEEERFAGEKILKQE